MKIKHETLGICEVEVNVNCEDSVDCYIDSGYSETLDRELTDDEVNTLNEAGYDFYSEWLDNKICVAEAYRDYLDGR